MCYSPLSSLQRGSDRTAAKVLPVKFSSENSTGFGHPGHQTSSGKFHPFYWSFLKSDAHLAFWRNRSVTAHVLGKGERKERALQAKKYLILPLLYCFHSTWFFGLAIKSEGFTLSEDLALIFLLNCLYWLHVKINMSWVFDRAKSQDCRFVEFFLLLFVICLLVFLSFFWKGLVVFIYCKQVGRAYKRSFVQQALVSGRLAALFEYLSFV